MPMDSSKAEYGSVGIYNLVVLLPFYRETNVTMYVVVLCHNSLPCMNNYNYVACVFVKGNIVL
jgi:hypothetical protein